MPQLVKGGKNVFAWSGVSDMGRILIPEDAFKEYGFVENETVILMSGSKTSGGFSLVRMRRLQDSPISSVLREHPELMNQGIPEGKSLEINSRYFCWTLVKDGGITIPHDTLPDYGIKRGDMLLVVRGSSLGLGFIVRGPIIEEAKKHKELKIVS